MYSFSEGNHPLLSVGDIPVSIKQLDLDAIPEEVLDECFTNENEHISLNSDIDDDLEVQIEEEDVDYGKNSYAKIRDTSEFISNEELLRNIKDGKDVSKNREKLVRQNYGLVYSEARKCTCNIPFPDKLQYGFEGLLNAIDKFDVNYKNLFATYATASIRNVMYRHGNNDVRLVALPEYLSVHNTRIQNFIDSYVDSHQLQPTVEQIALGTGIDVRSVKRLQSHSGLLISMDAPVHGVESDVTLQDVITGDDEDYQLDETCLSQDFREGIKEAMNWLNNAERKLFAMVNGFDGYVMMSFEQIISEGIVDERGKRITSKPTMSRRYTEVLAKMAKIIEDKGIQIRQK